MPTFFTGLFVSAITSFVIASHSSAQCIDMQSLSNGIVFEYNAPKGKLYEVSIDAGESFVLRTGYTSITPDREKIIYKSYLGLFTTESWYESKPDNPTRHTFYPALEQLPRIEQGAVIDYQETWVSPKHGQFIADRTLKVLGEKDVLIGGCTYKVQEIEVNSVVKLPNGKKSEQFATFLYIPRLYYKDGLFTFYDSDNMSIRTLSSNDFLPEKNSDF